MPQPLHLVPAVRPSLLKGTVLYLLMLALFVFGVYRVVDYGRDLENHSWKHITQSSAQATQPLGITWKITGAGKAVEEPVRNLVSNLTHPLSIALLQIIIIISLSRLFSYMMRQIGQPAVIGEIMAGIFLGPSLLGTAFPGAWSAVFPLASLPNLHAMSTIGLSLFMFIIGLDLDISMLNRRIQTALFVSHASILVPFFMGVVLAYQLYTEFAPGGVSFLTYGLFMGVSMSITAFPVLARIIQERGLSRTPLGVMAITCAATDDISAWCILAIVIAIAKAGDISSALLTLVLAGGYVLFMFRVIKPFMMRLGKRFTQEGQLRRPFVAISILILLCSAFVAEVIGIHALFGAFLAGVTIPQDARIREALRQKIEDVSLLLFLPVFFAFTGLRTQVGLLLSDGLWKIAALVLAVAVSGKLLGTIVAARLMGQNWKHSVALGALMNTRGLMELVVLNIGYDLGIISSEMFVVLVLMAIATTLMTGPLLNLIDRIWKEPEAGITPTGQGAAGPVPG